MYISCTPLQNENLVKCDNILHVKHLLTFDFLVSDSSISNPVPASILQPASTQGVICNIRISTEHVERYLEFHKVNFVKRFRKKDHEDV